MRENTLSTGGIQRNREFIRKNQPEGTVYTDTVRIGDLKYEKYKIDDNYVIVEQGVNRNTGWEEVGLVTVYKKT